MRIFLNFKPFLFKKSFYFIIIGENIVSGQNIVLVLFHTIFNKIITEIDGVTFRKRK